MPSPPHPRLRNRHSLPRAVSNGAPPSDYAARELWTVIPCDSLECRRVIPTFESPTIRTPGCRLSNVDRLERNITLVPNASWQRSTLTKHVNSDEQGQGWLD